MAAFFLTGAAPARGLRQRSSKARHFMCCLVCISGRMADRCLVMALDRESTNKQLRIWAKQGWVRLQRGAVTVLQPEKLDEVAAEAAELDAS